MTKEEVIKRIRSYDHLLANAVDQMIQWVRGSANVPNRDQVYAVNIYLRSMCPNDTQYELRRIISQKITIAAISVIDSQQLERMQRVLDLIAYWKV